MNSFSRCISHCWLQEVQEFTLDDSSRVRWDPMLKKAWLLQSSKDVAHSCEQVVVWLRR